ncbi:hypothetical protein J6590_027061 [Homalodisca vitripennis]|nr:hypothetical protein J6590_027061 [Homalodisca vitripennis]
MASSGKENLAQRSRSSSMTSTVPRRSVANFGVSGVQDHQPTQMRRSLNLKPGSLLAGLYLPVEPTTGHSKNRCATSIWATLWMSNSGVHGQFDRSSLLWKMTIGVGGVCSLTSEALVNLNKGVPPPAYFDWRGWFRAGLPFFWDDFEM